MSRLNIPLTNLTSKSWNEFADTPVDVVITVCDAASAQACPVWPGSPLSAHWSLPDPVYHPGTDDERLAFALLIAERLRAKIEGLVKLDWSCDRAKLKHRLEFLGEI
jgi:arsenate reductase